MLRYAIRITGETFSLIVKLNDGISPSLGVMNCYLMVPGEYMDANRNHVLTEDAFFDIYPAADRNLLIQIVR